MNIIKNITLILIMLFTITSYSQVIDYDAGALLFSQENIKGTARFTGMSGAFGSLGGDLSATNVNPAGLVVFNNSEATITIDNNNIDTDAIFYNTTSNSNNNNFNLSQAGAVLVFKNNNDYWNKFAIGVNYTIVNDFNNSYLTQGKSPLTEFNQDPFLNFNDDDTDDVFYENIDSQRFINSTTGSNDRITFSLASQLNKYLQVGISLNTYSLDYYQSISFNEKNNDGNNNTLDAYVDQTLLVVGDGASVSLGFILKPISNLRLGLSYQSPTWYNLNEEFNEEIQIYSSITDQTYFEDLLTSVFEYEIKTPSKITGSISYIFGEKGLISLDLIRKKYNNIKLRPSSEFETAEQDYLKELKNTTGVRIGGEYRYKNTSLRAGYHFEGNPVKTINTDTEGYSLGIGFKFSELTKLDLAYDNTTSTNNYDFISTASPADINKTNDRITATFIIGF